MKYVVSVLALCATAGLASATTWNEGAEPAAGPWPILGATYETVTGSGPLTAINGSIVNSGDVDTYLINICDPAAFSASTDNLNTIVDDTTLFLFRLDGTGIAKNDDVSGTNFLSALPVGNALYSSLTPGNYVLAVSYFGTVPFSTDPPTSLAQSTFDVFDFTGVIGPQNGPAVTWADVSSADGSGAYQIALTGACFVPAPGAAALLGLGGLALARRRR
jgi:hypothetical protein